MYKKQLGTSIVIDAIAIITFIAIVAIHHFDIAKALFPLLWVLFIVFVIECGLSFIYRNDDKRWSSRWKTPIWQIVLWICFVIGGVFIIWKFPDFWASQDVCFFFIFCIGSDLCRSITRYLIVKRYNFDKYDSVEELLSANPEAGKYIK